jgi:uncharacterized protein (TIGR03435 family)
MRLAVTASIGPLPHAAFSAASSSPITPSIDHNVIGNARSHRAPVTQLGGQMVRTIAMWVVGALLAASIAAQEAKPRFDVASVRRTESTFPRPGVIPQALPGGRFYASFATVEDLMGFAYDLRPHQIVGGSDWVRSHRFEINARAATEAPPDQIKRMVASLLDDRFKLVTHIEQRDVQVLALVRARPDGPLGPALIRIDECSPAMLGELRKRFPEKYPTPGNGLTSACSSRGLDNLAILLSIGGTPVIDATGLTDSFYFTIPSQGIPAVPGRTNADPNLPALSTVLDEQLGLKLESRRGPLDVLVIDSVQEPTEN